MASCWVAGCMSTTAIQPVHRWSPTAITCGIAAWADVSDGFALDLGVFRPHHAEESPAIRPIRRTRRMTAWKNFLTVVAFLLAAGAVLTVSTSAADDKPADAALTVVDAAGKEHKIKA